MLKKFFRFLVGSIFAVSLPLFIVTTIFFVIIRPNHIKDLIQKSGIYSSLPTTLVNEASNTQSQETSTSNTVDFKNSLVQKAANEALSTTFLKTSAEQIVDGTFKWLDGGVSKPDFSIDILGAKKTFATNLGNYAKQRYESLPACEPGTLPATTDVLSIDCQPLIDVNIDQQIESLTTDFLNNKQFLPEPTLNADNIVSVSSGDESVFSNNDLPKAYQFATFLPIVLAVTTLISGTSLVFMYDSKRKGVRKVSNRLIFSGVTAGILLLIGNFGIQKLHDKFAQQTDVNSSAYAIKEMMLSIVNTLRSDMLRVGGIVIGGVLALGIILALILLSTKKRNTSPKEPFSAPKVRSNPQTTLVDSEPRPEPTTAPPVKGRVQTNPRPTTPTKRRRPPLIQ